MVRGEPTGIGLQGYNKKEAFNDQAKQQWRLYFPGKPFLKRYKMKLVAISSYRE